MARLSLKQQMKFEEYMSYWRFVNYRTWRIQKQIVAGVIGVIILAALLVWLWPVCFESIALYSAVGCGSVMLMMPRQQREQWARTFAREEIIEISDDGILRNSDFTAAINGANEMGCVPLTQWCELRPSFEARSMFLVEYKQGKRLPIPILKRGLDLDTEHAVRDTLNSHLRPAA